jgi:putative transcription antitermination factor YqgF
MGLAIGDDETGVASPLAVVPYKGVDHAARRISAVAEESGATCVVIGLPSGEDGSVGPAARRSELLSEAITKLGLKVVLQKEFLTTSEARRRAREIGRPPRRPVDDLAAQILLEEHLAELCRSKAVEG